MKKEWKVLVVALLVIFGLSESADAQVDTLRHYDINSQQIQAPLKSGVSNVWGYRYGHGGNGIYEIAEKYTVDSLAQVVAIMAYIAGGANSDSMLKFSVYDTLALGVGKLKAREQIMAKNADAYRFFPLSATTVSFSDTVLVDGSFFVAFGFSPYDYVITNPSFQPPADTLSLFTTTNRDLDPMDTIRNRNFVRYPGGNWEDPVVLFGDTLNFLISPIVNFNIDTSSSDTNSTGISNAAIHNNRGLTMYPVFPNPAQDEVTVSFAIEQSSPVTIRVLSLNGREILQTEHMNAMAGKQYRNLDVSGLKTGNYLIMIQTNQGIMSTKLFKE